MGHLNTGPDEHDVTVSMYVIKTDGDEPRLFLHRHRVSTSWFQPGGHVERAETIWQTVTRELREETGYDIQQLRVLQPSPRFPPFVGQSYPTPLVMRSHRYDKLDHYHDDLVFAFTTHDWPRHELAADESQEFGFFTLAEVLAIEDSDIGPDVKVLANALLHSYHSWDEVSPTEYGTFPDVKHPTVLIPRGPDSRHQ